MKLLYIGDIMARPGRQVVAALLPKLIKKHKIDFVVAQAENVTHGIGITKKHMQDLQNAGVDFFSGGNHSVERNETLKLIADTSQPVNGPKNMSQTLGAGYKIVTTKFGDIALATFSGATFPKGYDVNVSNTLKAVDTVLNVPKVAACKIKIFNIHGDLSSEKRVFGYYVDGKVSAAVGDHWHVPSADAMLLPKGTAHVTDVGMCGTLHSSLGVKIETIIARWRDEKKNVNVLDEHPPYQFNAVLIDINEKTGLARSIKRVQEIINHPL